MSILIKGMEMPSSCSMCPMAHRNYRLEAEETQLACYAKSKWVSDDGERSDWCPLIEVPEHGRLIDADAFERNLILMQNARNQNNLVARGIRKARGVARDLPTVIPSDKDGET